MYFVLLLLTFFAATVTSETIQACFDATEALIVNQSSCGFAVIQVGKSISNNKSIDMKELNNFCSSNCRSLNYQVESACVNEVSRLLHNYCSNCVHDIRRILCGIL